MPSDIDQVLAALASPQRRAIVHLLRHGPLSAGALAERLSLNRPALSKHLRVLKDADLIGQELQEEDARVRMVHLRRAPLTALQDWLSEVESFWGDQLQGFQSHVEAKHRRTAK